VTEEGRDFRLVDSTEDPKGELVRFDRVMTFNGLEVEEPEETTVSWSDVWPYLPKGKTVADLKAELTIVNTVAEVLNGRMSPFLEERIKSRRPIFQEDPVPSGTWTRMDGRWWKCPKGHSNRAPKNVGDSMPCLFCEKTYALAK
jgi:hypothetical protein